MRCAAVLLARGTPILLLALAGCGSRGGVSVLRVPGGRYVVGCEDREICGENRRRVVLVPAFEIDKYEATAHSYGQCVTSGICPRKELSDAPRDPSRVLSLTVSEAHEYCRWRGGRIPTDVEWEVAARGGDERLFPWGNEPPGQDEQERVAVPVIVEGGARDWVYFRAGSTRSGDSAFGVSDMSGSLREYTQGDARELHLRGAPPGVLSLDVYEYSAVRIRARATNETAAVRCVTPLR
ncbi:MAG: formylglycine-generating enzyme family protein [Kofleriaceae bacterium]